MKASNQVNESTPITVASTAPPGSRTLAEEVQAFIEFKSRTWQPYSLVQLRRGLRHLTDLIGQAPPSQATSDHIRRAVVRSGHSCATQQVTLQSIKGFFRWLRAQGRLPDGEPTAADMVPIPKGFVPPMLTPEKLKDCLRRAANPEIALRLVLPAFSGAHATELMRLDWTDITPGRRVILNRGVEGKMRKVRMPAVLDSWLQPFYGCAGLVCDSEYGRVKFHYWVQAQHLGRLSKIVRNSYCAYSLILTSNHKRTVAEAGLSALQLKYFSAVRVNREDAEAYFSLTPGAVGIQDWPRIVAPYLARHSKPGPSQPT